MDHAEAAPRIMAEVKRHRTYRSADSYGYELDVKRAHNTWTYTELTLADLYRLRGAIQMGIDKIESGEL